MDLTIGLFQDAIWRGRGEILLWIILKYARMSKGERKGLTFNLQGGGAHIFEMGGAVQTCAPWFQHPYMLTICGYFSGSVTLMSVSLMFRN